MLPFRNLFTSPSSIVIKDNFFTEEELKNLFQILNKISFMDGGIQGNEPEGNIIQENFRRSQLKWIPFNSDTEWIYNKIHDFIIKCNEEYWKFNLVSMNEPLQYTEYDYSYKGHFGWHVDIGEGSASCRKISITIQLSSEEEYEGGELMFNIGGEIKTIPKQKNQIIVFPSYILHKISPVIKGNRKSLVMWVGGVPFR